MKKSNLILSIVAAGAISLPASAQLGGAVNSTLGAAGSARGGQSGLGGDISVVQKAGATVQGAGTLGADVNSQVEGSAQATKQRSGEAVKSAKDKTKQTKDKAADVATETKGRVDAKAEGAEEQTQETAKSAEVSSSTKASANSSASSQKGSKSANGDLGLSQTLNAAVGGQNVNADADADAKADAKIEKHSMQKPESDEKPKPKKSEAAAENSNSGDAHLHGLDRAESRVENNTHADAVIDRNQERQATAKAKSSTKGAVNLNRGKKN